MRRSPGPRHDTAAARYGRTGDQLTMAGVKVAELANHHPGPVYLYSGSVLREQVAKVRTALPEQVDLRYAVKANPHSEILICLAPLVDGYDVASLGEINACQAAGINPSSMGFAGPAKRVAEIEAAVDLGVTLHVESLVELERIIAAMDHASQAPRVALRVNPDFELQRAGMKMGGRATAFGMDLDSADEALRRVRGLPLEFRGFHIFAGSQNLDAGALVDCQQRTLDLCRRLAEKAPVAPVEYNIGGGFGVPYFPGDQQLDIQQVGNALDGALRNAEEWLNGAKVCIELGRYLVAEAGLYVCQVIDIKTSHGETFVLTDGGLHHHLAASGNFGQVLRRNYPMVVAEHLEGDARDLVNVVGPLCTPLDILGARIELARPAIGDHVVVFLSGAYGWSASPHHFLGHPPPVQQFIP